MFVLICARVQQQPIQSHLCYEKGGEGRGGEGREGMAS